MRINEVVGGLQTFTARIRIAVDGMGAGVCEISIRAASASQARLLLAKCYGKSNVLSIRQVVTEEGLKTGVSAGVIAPIKPKKNTQRSIKPLTPKQGMKRAVADLKKSTKYNERKTKAQLQVRKYQTKLTDINRKPPVAQSSN